MNPKNVWGIILIILGILFIFSGLNEFRTISLVENEISLLNKTAISFLGKSYSNLFGMDNSKELLRNEKIKCVLSVLLGIAGAFFGTLMLNRNAVPKANQLINGNNHDDSWKLSDNEKFKTESDEAKTKDDNTKWMHPDMREHHNKSSFKF